MYGILLGNLNNTFQVQVIQYQKNKLKLSHPVSKMTYHQAPDDVHIFRRKYKYDGAIFYIFNIAHTTQSQANLLTYHRWKSTDIAYTCNTNIPSIYCLSHPAIITQTHSLHQNNLDKKNLKNLQEDLQDPSHLPLQTT